MKIPCKLIPTSVRIFSNSGNIAATRNFAQSQLVKRYPTRLRLNVSLLSDFPKNLMKSL